MKLFVKLINWCFEEKPAQKVVQDKKPFYIPCNKFYNLTELKEERRIKAQVKN